MEKLSRIMVLAVFVTMLTGTSRASLQVSGNAGIDHADPVVPESLKAHSKNSRIYSQTKRIEL